MRPPVVLVLAKAPVPGRAKTRLAASVGEDHAARLANAALLDTLAVCEEAFGADRCYLSLSGELDELDPADRRRLRARLRGWTVLPQRGPGFGHRIERAHRDVHEAAGAPVVQIGMDTPHLAPSALREVGATVARDRRPVLGPAADGGWWVLASTRAADVSGLRRVPMSTPRTGAATLHLLHSTGLGVTLGPEMRDVDDAADAEYVAEHAPDTRFAQTWRAVTGSRVGQGLS